MKNIMILLVTFLFVSCNCPEKKIKPKKKDNHVKNNKSKKLKKEILPETVIPSTEKPEISKFVYDPSKDPINKGGFTLIKNRKADDPTDAKKKPFTIETLYKLKSIYSLKWSPDSSRLLFTLATRKLKEGKSIYEIYIVNRDGSGLRKLTSTEKMSYHPVWSPDGKSFMFISTREKGAQVWIMNLSGGDPERITSISTGAGDPIFSPDGKKIIFSSTVFPEYGADDKSNKKLLDDIKKSSVKAHIADNLLFRHWTSYSDQMRSHVFSIDIESKKVVDLTPGDFESPAFSLGGGRGFVVSPDSKEICFVSNRESPDARSWTTNKDLFVVPIEGGKAVNLTKMNKAFDGEPMYSPDGNYIAYLMQKIPGYESDRMRIAVYDRKSGKIKVLSEGFDNMVYDFKWSSDSKSIFFEAAVKGRYPLYNLELKTGKINKIKEIPSAMQFDISKKGEFAFTFGRVGTPTELYFMDSKKKIKKITGFNDLIVKEYDIRPAEEMWIPGADGKKVHTFIVKPHGFKKGKKYPLVINVHGGPQMQWADYLRGDWQVYPGAGYIVAFPNPHGSTGYGQKYTAAISKDWGGKVYEDVMKVTDALSKLDYVDKNRMGAMGWSYGGYMMNWILGHSNRFKALVSMMGVYDLPSMYGGTEELWFIEWDAGGNPWDNPLPYKKFSPSSYVKNFKTPTLVISGEKDYRIPYTQSLQLFTALRRRGVDSKLIIFPNDGHWPNYVKSMPLYYAAHLYWFKKYLGGGGSPWKLIDMVRGRAFTKKK